MALAGPLIVAKGKQDIVWTFMEGGSVCYSPPAAGTGCPKRCGGQGDVLTGLLATTAAWAIAYVVEQVRHNDPPHT